MPFEVQKASASFNSRSWKVAEDAVAARTPSPSASRAAYSKKVESTPPEKATIALPRPRSSSKSDSYLFICSLVGAPIFRSIFMPPLDSPWSNP